MDGASEDPTTFSAHSLPADPRLWATATSAWLGTRVFGPTLHVSGVYNGAQGDTHRAALPSPLSVRLEAPTGAGGQLVSTFTLDTNTGSFLHSLEGPAFRASQRLYAHRTLPHVLACSVSITRLATGRGAVTVPLHSAFSPESPDLALRPGPCHQGAQYLYGHTLTPEQPGGPRQELHMLWTPVPPALTLEEGEEDGYWEFLTVVAGSQAEAQARLDEALRLRAGPGLYPGHAQAWAQLWAGCGLDVAGPLRLRQALRGALYYLLGALPPPGATDSVCHGLSPGGLSNGSRGECYWGHVFWDQDLWMFPNVLLLHPEAARALLQYRIRTLGGALENARRMGYRATWEARTQANGQCCRRQGAKFAWESAGSGLEVCPEEVYGAQELHVSGAVALAFQLYYHATQDVQLFREAGGWDVVSAVAEFWCSRVEWSPQEGQYHLRGVMPPDEYHAGVDNSVYTNTLVRNKSAPAAPRPAAPLRPGKPVCSPLLLYSLRFAATLAKDLGRPVPDQWLRVAEGIKVPFDPERGFHPEFDGYEPGEEVKQADVVLLGYPVPFPLSPRVRRNNLEVYESVTSPRGPAMTWSMFAVGWLELGEPARARALLDRSFANVSEPFKVSLAALASWSGAGRGGAGRGPQGLRCSQVWTENADGSGAVNFLTGMGGFLQAALFGVTGFRITQDGLTFDPVCPEGVSGVSVWGVSYLGNKLDFSLAAGSLTLEVTARSAPSAPLLEAELWPSQARLPLPAGRRVSFPCTAGRIQRALA
ncbi:Protein-glucosylgalactosylhydroxylysine glucosidase [Galemys pyrenaicus]|uniref:Protein-glucosylgalactosylhydroxylysine glucosidase n=1 Tax=Galemys pyrenaicus TaxID=202257 RepID=A0A8J6A887_GALPY|nr:Protein-glucosylgalactosylhydroxylysine glucosidase [Galemys pyrenaicus]